MLKEETSVLRMGRPCDVCRTAGCAVYCRAELAYLCAACDASVHAVMRHERVRVCQACERAPSAFLCKADSASLCGACDADVHSANPLARRHHRVPVVPISEADHESLFEMIDEEDENEAASWLLFNPAKASSMDEYLDLDDNTSTCQDTKFKEYFSTDQQQQYSSYYESVVPIQSEMRTNYLLEMECCDRAKTRHNPAVSSCHSVSVSSMEVVVVPESSTSDMSISHSRPPKGIIDLFSSPSMQMPTQLSPMDREARVMRYREKKKTRKFEKTIRYASRKAYAETRPRIKGRFAKRTDLEAEVDQMFSTSVFVEGGYGIVPSY